MDQYWDRLLSASAQELVTSFHQDIPFIREDLTAQDVSTSKIEQFEAAVHQLVEFACIMDGAMAIPSGKARGYPPQPKPERLLAMAESGQILLFNHLDKPTRTAVLSIYQRGGLTVEDAYSKAYLKKMQRFDIWKN